MLRKIIFYDNWTICLDESSEVLRCTSPQDVVIENQYSLVSAGTELMILNGEFGPIESEGHIPGYGSIGTVIDVGSEVTRFKRGDRVFTHGKHASFTLSDGLTLKIPDGLSDYAALLARMAQVSATAIRVAQPEIGDFVVVQGQGLVGNLCSQLFALSGCRVIALDTSAVRLAALAGTGVEFALNVSDQDPVSAIAEITNGRGAEYVIEASGVANLVNQASRMAGKNGKVVLVGSPRGEYTESGKELLKSVFKWQQGCVTLAGAHEWRYPIYRSEDSLYKHSMERNIEMFWNLVQQNKFSLDPLISEVAHPADAESVYQRLNAANEMPLGIVFDWRNKQ
jgi:2-desacetyl-2-hydroxyethyl bacteriochlorophyllide A dehydrogenase